MGGHPLFILGMLKYSSAALIRHLLGHPARDQPGMELLLASHDNGAICGCRGAKTRHKCRQRLRRSAGIRHQHVRGDAGQPKRSRLMDLGQDCFMVKAAIGEAQTPGGDRGRLDRQTLIGGPTVVQIECTQCTREEAELDAAFEARGPATGVVATPTPDRRQRVGKLNTRAVVNPNAEASAGESGWPPDPLRQPAACSR